MPPAAMHNGAALTGNARIRARNTDSTPCHVAMTASRGTREPRSRSRSNSRRSASISSLRAFASANRFWVPVRLPTG
jgi:hypothetical protein